MTVSKVRSVASCEDREPMEGRLYEPERFLIYAEASIVTEER